MQLADVLAEDLETGVSPEPIELGMSQIDGLCDRVIDDELVACAAELTELRAALERYRRGSGVESTSS